MYLSEIKHLIDLKTEKTEIDYDSLHVFKIHIPPLLVFFRKSNEKHIF